jgi:O-methyltransferase involved in polyketide biosynthesis
MNGSKRSGKNGGGAPAGGDLSVTALYTCGTWAWAGLPAAEIFDHPDAQRVFGVTNAALSLARPFFGKPPSLRHSLVQRHVMIDRLLAESGARGVLEIAAGLSRRGAAATSADAALHYVELDRPHVVARKRTLAERSEAGRAALANPRWRLVGGDAADASLPGLIADFPADAKLFVIAEGLLMYLDAAAQRGLWRRVRELFDGRDGAFVFDLVPAVEQPRPGAVGRGLEWTMKRFTGGQAFERDVRTRADLARELSAAGFTVELVEPKSAPAAWQLPFTDIPTQQLLFVARPAR